MKPRERILATLNGQIPDRVPWLEMVIDPAVAEKLLGRPSEFRGRLNIDPNLLDILALNNIAVNLKPRMSPRSITPPVWSMSRPV